jgi:hypothetical protein
VERNTTQILPMTNLICWICSNGLAYNKYTGTKLLSDEGEKPCFDCIQESLNVDEEAEEVEA